MRVVREAGVGVQMRKQVPRLWRGWVWWCMLRWCRIPAATKGYDR